MGRPRSGCSERAARRERRGYSAATTTTATTRDAAQINCAALGEHELEGGRTRRDSLPNRHRDQANSGSSAERRSAAVGTPAVRYRCGRRASKMKVVGSDSTESRRAASGLASMSISTWATPGSSAHTWSTTRRTPAHGPHHTALKCTMVGPVRRQARDRWCRRRTAASARPPQPGAQRDQPADHVRQPEAPR